jgi:hypothetical protein
MGVVEDHQYCTQHHGCSGEGQQDSHDADAACLHGGDFHVARKSSYSDEDPRQHGHRNHYRHHGGKQKQEDLPDYHHGNSLGDDHVQQVKKLVQQHDEGEDPDGDEERARNSEIRYL